MFSLYWSFYIKYRVATKMVDKCMFQLPTLRTSNKKVDISRPLWKIRNNNPPFFWHPIDMRYICTMNVLFLVIKTQCKLHVKLFVIMYYSDELSQNSEIKHINLVGLYSESWDRDIRCVELQMNKNIIRWLVENWSRNFRSHHWTLFIVQFDFNWEWE